MKSFGFTPFEKPVYVTRPVLPDLKKVFEQFEAIWDSRWLTNNGQKHTVLEQKLGDFLKSPHISLFNNGTIALFAGVKILGLSGEVITTPFTFPATVHALSMNNIQPVFCDIDSENMNIDPDKIEALITSKTSAILPVHVFGVPCDVDKIQKIANRHKLKVLYDAAHAFGVELNSVGIGNYGDMSMFSFHATKLFHTAEGGALTFNKKSLKHKADLIKNFGIQDEETVVMAGFNGKMNELQAALGLVVLEMVEAEQLKRKALIQVYKDVLAEVEGVSFSEEKTSIKSNYQYFVIRIDEKYFGKSRDFVYDKFKEYNIFTRKYFYPLCSEYDFYNHLPSSNKDNLPVAYEISNQVLSMPLYGELSAEEIVKICNILKSFR